jgi:hypothetical protein
MAFFIHARDAAGCITLRRESREAAAKKAEELRAMGYFEVEIVEQAEIKGCLTDPSFASTARPHLSMTNEAVFPVR